MILPLALILLGGAAPSNAGVTPAAVPARVAPLALDTYESLMEAFEKAKAERRAQIRATKSPKERRALREKGVALDFRERFETLGKGGDVRAYLWMLDEAKGLGVARDARKAHALDVYGKIVMAPPSSRHFVDALGRLGEDKNLDAGQRVNLLKRVLGREDATGESRCVAQFHAGVLLKDSEAESDQAMGEQLLKELIANEACSEWAAQAENVLLGVSLEVGGVAPNFFGRTIDGDTFQLSDYRGKVVLIDFFGFW
ncbi:MAG: hypothetical protein KDB61_00815 [Planctomycetes bacterium]|nr:hypothetical protein [Planctomycetota bacterium]